MTKTEFLAEMHVQLQGLPQNDIEKSLAYYAEIIDDCMEDGLSEEETIASLGSVEKIVAQILTDIPLPRLVHEKVRPSHTLRTGELLLLILGSPIWVPVVLAVLLLFLGIYMLLWLSVVVLYAADFAAFFCGAAGVCSIVPFALSGYLLQGVFLLGLGLVSIGIGILFLFVCNKAAVLILRGSKWFLLRIKYAFVRRSERR